MLDYNQYIFSLNVQFNYLINSRDEYSPLKDNFILCDEQYINKNANKINQNSVYAVLNFGTSTINYGQTELTVDIEFMGKSNNLETLQSLLNLFVETYNLQYLYDTSVLQSYSTPILNSSFNIIDSGIRAIFHISGVFLITENIIDIQKIEYKVNDSEYEELPYLKIIQNIQNQALPEAFSGTYGRTTSTLQFQTQTINITLYPTNTTFLSTILKDQIEAQGDFTKKYTLKLTYNNDIVSEFEYSLTSIYHEKSKAGIPMISLTFTR